MFVGFPYVAFILFGSWILTELTFKTYGAEIVRFISRLDVRVTAL